jgi:hypothetical protein
MSFLQQPRKHPHRRAQASPTVDTLPTQRRPCPSPQYGLYSSLESQASDSACQPSSLMLMTILLTPVKFVVKQVRMVVMFASMVVMPARLRSDSIRDVVEQSRPCQMGYSAGVRLSHMLSYLWQAWKTTAVTEPHIPVSQPAHGSCTRASSHGRAQFPCLSLSSPWSSP